jgi:hypothetical protein
MAKATCACNVSEHMRSLELNHTDRERIAKLEAQNQALTMGLMQLNVILGLLVNMLGVNIPKHLTDPDDLAPPTPKIH